MILKITQPGRDRVGMPVYVTIKCHNIHVYGTYCVLGTTPGLHLPNLTSASQTLLRI